MKTIDQIENELSDEGLDANEIMALEIMALEIDAIELTGDGTDREFINTVQRLRKSGLYERKTNEGQ